MRRNAKHKQNGQNRLLEQLKQANVQLKTAKKKIEKPSLKGEKCKACYVDMEPSDVGYVCPKCGSIGELVGATNAGFSSTDKSCNTNESSLNNGVCSTFNDNYNDMYCSVLRRLTNKSQSTHPIPLEILRETARAYTELCQSIRASSDNAENKRCNMVLPAILKQQLDSHPNMAKTDTYICSFMGIEKGVLTKAKNKLCALTNDGLKEHVPAHDNIAALTYQFLDRLGLNKEHTDVVVRIIRRTDVQIDMINYRTCQNETKIVGTIWLLIRQLELKISHSVINKSLFKISKSTYGRFTEFLDRNRKKINPILVNHNIRPIPRSFAQKLKGRGTKKLKPIPEQYKGMFITG